LIPGREKLAYVDWVEDIGTIPIPIFLFDFTVAVEERCTVDWKSLDGCGLLREASPRPRGS
jgi:hypothetical protein